MINYFVILALIAIGIVIAVTNIKSAKKERKNLEIVEDNSVVLQSARELNTKQDFQTNMNPSYTFSTICKTNKAVETFDFDKFFLDTILANFEFFENLIITLAKNNENYDDYVEEYNTLFALDTPDTEKLGITNNDFVRIEDDFHKKNQLTAILDVEITLLAFYYSPSGKHDGVNSRVYETEQLLEFYNKAVSMQD